MRILVSLALAALVGCAGNPASQSVNDARTTQTFASRAECDRLADHLFTMRLYGSAPPDRPAESLAHGGAPYYLQFYNDFMAQCTTKLSQRDVACLLEAPGYAQVRACQVQNGTPYIIGMRQGRRTL